MEYSTHGDAGLQPERTHLAWGRTTLSMGVAGAIFLRWLPHHGWFIGTLVTAATLTALVMSLTRQRRYSRAAHGIRNGAMTPDIASSAALAGSVVILAALGIYSVFLLPLK